MHATLRRLKCAPGRASEVAKLIQSEYIPQLTEVEGVISYTLVHSGQDEVAGVGVFTSQAGAMRANELAQAWTRERLADVDATPLEAVDGEVLVHTDFSAAT